ncbi:DUF6311 domain-containing protein [Roseomonas sp. NAR14]|uniref:DUF6311 domain-containing protein n=1 Tax=Roseomonas acroporae TaxID=2937791 RepID=A0A9X2BV96_9PROT|nr:DUF6311 domain-containing protein [Roseomonas acroporae]MCK8786462.1 DUF6311 domain-containing protein [Roseomonas acroporae]
MRSAAPRAGMEPQPPGITALGAALAVLMGFGAFVAIGGLAILDPARTGWLNQGDPSTYVLAWRFFVQSPWHFPPGANPDYGLELGSSIYNADIIPILAMPLKALSGVLPLPQYLGLWVLLCFLLQALGGWLLMGQATTRPLPRLLGTGLLVAAPVFLFRIGGHYALSSHWLILFALWLAVAPPWRRQGVLWVGLLVLAAGIHSYILVMVAALWGADLLRRLLLGRSWGATLAEAACGVLGVFLLLWLSGFFLIGTGYTSAGYGEYRFNLLALLHPDGWSRLLPPIPLGTTLTESPVFPGLGGLVAWAAALVALLVGRRGRRPALSWQYVPLLLVLLGLLAFAVTYRPSIGTFERWLPFPPWALRIANVLRSAARFVWPMLYLLTMLAVLVLVRRWGSRAASAVLAAALALQVWDTSPGWLPLRNRYLAAPAQWNLAPGAPFWGAVLPHYRRIRRLPPQMDAAGWSRIATLAADHRLGLDMVYLARWDLGNMEALRREAESMVANGRFDPETVYILGNPAFAASVLLGLDPAGDDLLVQVDGFYVLAPGGKRFVPDPAAVGAVPIRPEQVLPALRIGETLRTVSGESGTGALSVGWSRPESTHTWNDGKHAEIVLRLPADLPERVGLRITGMFFLPPRWEHQRLIFSVGGHEIGRFTGSGAIREMDHVMVLPRDRLMPIPGGYLLRLGCEFPDAVRPIDAQVNADDRALALGIKSIGLVETP